MEGVSEIDAKFGKLFTLAWAKLNDEQKIVVMTYFHEKIKEIPWSLGLENFLRKQDTERNK